MGNKEEVKIIRKRNQWQDEWWKPKETWLHDVCHHGNHNTTISMHLHLALYFHFFYTHFFYTCMQQEEWGKRRVLKLFVKVSRGIKFFCSPPPPDFTSRSQVREKWEKQTWRIKCWWKMSLVIEQIWGDLWCRCRKYFIDSLYFMHYWQ